MAVKLKVKSIFLILALVLASVPMYSQDSYAQIQTDCTNDEDFLSDNNIPFYNPCVTIVSCTYSDSNISITDSSENAEAIFKFFISTNFSSNDNKPLTPIQAAAFLGNFYQESRFNPASIQSGKTYDEHKAFDSEVGGYGFGLAQWDSSRRVDLLNFAKSKSATWSDLVLQLEFIKHEVEGTEKRILTNSEFKDISDVARATELVMNIYERPGHKALSNRIDAAKAAYAKYQGLAPGVMDELSSGCNSAGLKGGNRDIAATATALSWSQRAEEGATDHTALQNKPEYTEALKVTGVDKLGDSCSMGGNSCDAFLATVLRFSEVDPDFPCCGANAQNDYMKKSPKYELIAEKVTDTSQLQSGDLMWRDGHVKIYIGDGREAAASHCKRTAEQSKVYFEGGYTVYRFKGGDYGTY